MFSKLELNQTQQSAKTLGFDTSAGDPPPPSGTLT